MRLFLAGSGWEKLWIPEKNFDFYRLESYFYISKKEIPYINQYKSFILDSGAFTYLNGCKTTPNWDKYIEDYADFIKTNKVKYFIELDIDSVVGLKEVERLRNKLEVLTGQKSIPVWHKSRGLEYWEYMTKNYDYVAIGGIVTKEIKSSQYDMFIPLLNIAKENNCKVHGLGFTNLTGLEKYSFYSVDSTSWLSGNRFGSVYLFNGRTMIKHDKKEGQRVKTLKVALHNFKQWIKFSKYAELNL